MWTLKFSNQEQKKLSVLLYNLEWCYERVMRAFATKGQKAKKPVKRKNCPCVYLYLLAVIVFFLFFSFLFFSFLFFSFLFFSFLFFSFVLFCFRSLLWLGVSCVTTSTLGLIYACLCMLISCACLILNPVGDIGSRIYLFVRNWQIMRAVLSSKGNITN